MKAQVKQWGNSAAIRLPVAILMSMKLEVDSELELTERDGEIILTPIKGEYLLEDLLNAITPENLHEEYFFGEPVGKECW